MISKTLRYVSAAILAGVAVAGPAKGQPENDAQTRGFTRPSLSVSPASPSPAAPRISELTAISTMIADGKPTQAIMEAWKSYVARRVQAKQTLDVPATVQQIRRQAEAEIKTRMDAVKKRTMEDKLNAAGDDAQLANVDLQNVLQKQQQTLQMMSNMSKMLHDTAMATIRKIGG